MHSSMFDVSAEDDEEISSLLARSESVADESGPPGTGDPPVKEVNAVHACMCPTDVTGFVSLLTSTFALSTGSSVRAD